MAAVRLSDIVEPAVFLDYQTSNTVEKTAFAESGIAVRTPVLDAKANSGGKIVDIPFWKDLSNEEANISNDDPSSVAVPAKIASGEQVARVSYMNKSWSATDLASEIAGSNAMGRIKERTDAYWTRQWQRRLMASVQGVMAGNLVDNSGDMVYDIGTDAAGAPAAGQLFSRSAFTSAAFTLGDAFEATGVLCVHSVVYKRMVDNDDIDFVADSVGRMTIPTFLGKRVVVDDGMPAVAGANRIKYTSVLFGAGAIGYGIGSPETPVEVTREALQGNGAGVEILTTRKTEIVHPFGFKFNSASVAATSPTIAELKLAANWTRVFDERKQVPVAFLVTNG